MDTILLLASGTGPQAKTLFIQAAAFLLLLWILKRFALPHLRKALTGRSGSIRDTYRKIERDTSDSEVQAAEARDRLARIGEEARRRTDAALQEGLKIRETMIAETRDQARAEMEKVGREIDTEREKAILEVRLEAAQLTLQAAERIVGQSMNEQVQGRLVEGYLNRLEGLR